MTHARIGRKIPPRFSLDVEFPIGPGVTAIYGPPEAGKSLILEAIAGFVVPDSGRVLLDDVILFDAVSRVHVPPRHRHCGHISQAGSLFPHMTLRQNLMFPARRLPRLERHRRVAEMLDQFRLADVAGCRPAEVSPAERVRCAAARALVFRPKLLLIDDCGFDEPLLRQVCGASACPILLVSRDLDLCCSADELLVVDAGRILQRGAPPTVLDEPDSVEVARLLAIPNLFQGTIAALDPGRNSSRLEFDHFALTGPYIRGHFRGDRVWVAVRAGALRVHAGAADADDGFVSAQLIRASHRAQSVRLEFSNGIFADISREDFARQRDNKEWRVEFPPQALRVL